MALSFVASHARQGLVTAALFLALLVPAVPTQAESAPHPSVLIDNFVITDVKGLANIKAEMAAGKPKKQSLAIAYFVKRKAMGKKGK